MTGRAFGSRHAAMGLVTGVAAIAVVSGVIAVLQEFVDPRGLSVLYLFAVFPVAIGWGFWAAGIVTLASFLTFAFFFSSPVHSFRIADSDAAAALAISLVTAYVVSELARRSFGHAGEARLRAQEAEEAQVELRRLADEQAALRRVATLVAQAVPTAEVFEAVTREVGLRCDADLARMERFEADGTVTAVAAWSRGSGAALAVGMRFPLAGASIAAQVYETGRPARVDSFEGATGPIAREAQALGIRSSVGCPIVVGGRTWGVIAASIKREAPFPAHTESGIADFTELVAAAVSNAESQAELRASRARVVATADETRRQIERNLHDGVQQRAVSLALWVRAAQGAVPPELDAELDRVAAGLADLVEELREIASGIHPAILTEGGLGPALRTLARRSAVPAQVDVRTEGRLSEPLEVGAYYVVSEALTNAAKHAHASTVVVEVKPVDDALIVCVRDDGIGGAELGRGSGLVGLKDRVESLGGRISVVSAPGAGTSVRAELPLANEGVAPR
jgi:signal transduction histidine kinase